MNPLYQEKDYDRALKEPEAKTHASPFRRDYARVIHSASFRRLQGKTQIFPCLESDFFRNRLTHSLEVAQVAKSIALVINARQSDICVDTDLVETAALCHDIGHPPFGHNGERALYAKMREYGGFEGNAQTLRLLAKTEKKVRLGEVSVQDGRDCRYGLNLTWRTLAALLKYDREIPAYIVTRSEVPIKGYYASEKPLVNQIKQHVLSGFSQKQLYGKAFKTIECSIMDLADDIAYSTYDIEDAFKGGFLDPLSIVNASDELLEKVKQEAEREGASVSISEVRRILQSIFSGMIDFSASMSEIYACAKKLAHSSYLRTQFTSNLVHHCLSNIQFELDEACPVLSKVSLKQTVRHQVEILKNFIYFSIINAPKMNIIRYRGRDIINTLFDILIDMDEETLLLPEDIGEVFYAYPKEDRTNRARVICDFISSMTDQYAIELYSRFKSDTLQTIFKPVG